nr:LLM class F420-dependent oxidoreductase [Kibdelosporangium sp. MJ126-NF4]CEL15789.1 Coenzyme F420-dependent N5,N10-methylene tetrahydromethanopterin reductase and related flavin-dependent oxidoreductases [Kibdelosporangium sp. MJ126-NF4]CTQ93714.1 Coenzyme F420-dependent N5,N10-methylene tetrahydromethanopterin reductase and related flavin-dependent oxidoreductases [Kibdelosporangium sp. MJ126-NF4]
MQLGKVGIWSMVNLWDGRPEAAANLEKLGFGTLWLGGSPAADLRVAEAALDVTSTLVVATGIVNVWATEAADVAESYHRIVAKHPDRFLLGVGAGHKLLNTRYEKPYTKLVSYLDELDAAGVPASGRALAALGPKVLTLAAERTAGAHPYFSPVEHTRAARKTLGDGPLLAPEVAVVLEPDRAVADRIIHDYTTFYLRLTNYTNNLLRYGFTEEDFADGGSDRLLGALIPQGVDNIVATVAAHHEAGADHVDIQVLTADGSLDPEAFETLGNALT